MLSDGKADGSGGSATLLSRPNKGTSGQSTDFAQCRAQILLEKADVPSVAQHEMHVDAVLFWVEVARRTGERENLRRPSTKLLAWSAAQAPGGCRDEYRRCSMEIRTIGIDLGKTIPSNMPGSKAQNTVSPALV